MGGRDGGIGLGGILVIVGIILIIAESGGTHHRAHRLVVLAASRRPVALSGPRRAPGRPRQSASRFRSEAPVRDHRSDVAGDDSEPLAEGLHVRCVSAHVLEHPVRLNDSRRSARIWITTWTATTM